MLHTSLPTHRRLSSNQSMTCGHPLYPATLLVDLPSCVSFLHKACITAAPRAHHSSSPCKQGHENSKLQQTRSACTSENRCANSLEPHPATIYMWHPCKSPISRTCSCLFHLPADHVKFPPKLAIKAIQQEERGVGSQTRKKRKKVACS